MVLTYAGLIINGPMNLPSNKSNSHSIIFIHFDTCWFQTTNRLLSKFVQLPYAMNPILHQLSLIGSLNSLLESRAIQISRAESLKLPPASSWRQGFSLKSHTIFHPKLHSWQLLDGSRSSSSFHRGGNSFWSPQMS